MYVQAVYYVCCLGSIMYVPSADCQNQLTVEWWYKRPASDRVSPFHCNQILSVQRENIRNRPEEAYIIDRLYMHTQNTHSYSYVHTYTDTDENTDLRAHTPYFPKPTHTHIC